VEYTVVTGYYKLAQSRQDWKLT